MEFKHSFEAEINIKATRDNQHFALINADLAEFDSPKLALAGVETLISTFLSTTKTAIRKSIEIFSQTDLNKVMLITVVAKVRHIATGKTYLIGYKFANDSAAAYATYHTAAINAMSAMIDLAIYVYDVVDISVTENPEYIPS
jgi:hypothetical protein